MKETFTFNVQSLASRIAKDYATSATITSIIEDDGRLKVVEGKVDMSSVGLAFNRYKAVDVEDVGRLLMAVNLHVLNQGYQAWYRLSHRLISAEARDVLRS